MTMPPQAIEVLGPAAIAQFFLDRDWWGVSAARRVSTRANGLPAFGVYLSDPHAPIGRTHSLIVLTLERDGISHITLFGDLSLFARFGLPRTLDAKKEIADQSPGTPPFVPEASLVDRSARWFRQAS
jgi:hypothetical protein